MKRASDYEAANAVDEVILHAPFSRRAFVASPFALALSPAVLAGLGLALAPTPASATTLGSWVLYETMDYHNGKAKQYAYYYVDPTPTSDNKYKFKLRLVQHCYQSYTYGIGFTMAYNIYDNGTYVGNLTPPSWEKSGKVRNSTWIQKAGDEISGETGWMYTTAGGGSHRVTSNSYAMGSTGGTGSNWDFTLELPYVGKLSIDVRAICGKDTAHGQTAHAIPDGDYVIRYRDNDGYCVALGTTNNAAAVVCGNKDPQLRWFSSSTAEMYWHLDYTSESNANTFHVRPITNLCLGLETPNAVSTSCRAGVWHINGNAHHHWQLAKDSSGNYELLAGHNSSMALDLANASVTSGNAINVHPRNSTAAQRWKLQLVRPADGSAITEWPAEAKLGPDGIVYALDNASGSEVARVTMTKRGATFDKTIKSTDLHYVRMVSAPAGIRLDTKRRGVRLCQNGDTAFLTYEILPATYTAKTIDEDDKVTTLAQDVRLGWSGDSVTRFSSLHAKTWYYGDVPDEWEGRETEWRKQCWGVYDRDPKESGAALVGGSDLSTSVDVRGSVTLVTRLPDTVTVYAVVGDETNELWKFPLRREKTKVKTLRSRLKQSGVTALADLANGSSDWYHQVYSNEACTTTAFDLDVASGTWTPSAHAKLYVKAQAFTVTYVVDGETMATDKVNSTSSWEVPATRTAQATKAGCTPGFSGWCTDAADEAVTADEAGLGGSSLVTGPIAVRSNLTLYATNRATVSFGVDERSTADVTDGEVRVGPLDSDAEAGDAEKGLLPAVTRKVNKTAALPALTANLYKRTAGGRYVTCKPDAWYVPGGSEATSGLRVGSDVTVGVIWSASTNDGVSARR